MPNVSASVSYPVSSTKAGELGVGDLVLGDPEVRDLDGVDRLFLGWAGLGSHEEDAALDFHHFGHGGVLGGGGGGEEEAEGEEGGWEFHGRGRWVIGWDWRCDVRVAEPRACRSGDRRSKPGAPCGGRRVATCAVRSPARAGQETGVPGRERHAGGGGLRRARCGAPRVPVWRPAFQAGAPCGGRKGCDVRVAAPRACRQETGVPGRGRHAGGVVATCALRSPALPVWRPAFQAGGVIRRTSVARCRLKPAFQAGSAISSRWRRRRGGGRRPRSWCRR